MSCIDFKVLEKTSIPKRRIDCYELYLERLVNHLNYVHKTSHDAKYWEILIGPWLLYFVWHIDCVFFGDTSLAEKSKKTESDLYVPYDLFSFMSPLDLEDCSVGINFPLQNNVETSERSFKCFRTPHPEETIWKILFKKVYAYIYRLISVRANVVLAAPYFSLLKQFEIALLSRFRVVPFLSNDIDDVSLALNFENRKWHEARTVFDNDLDAILDKLVVQRIPYVHLEGYLSLLKKLPPLSTNLKVICSAVGWHHDELLKCLFARHYENGGQLVGIQHGGNPYGTGINPMSLEEKEIVDKYLTWGWKKNGKDIPFISMKTSFRKKEFDSKKQKEGKDILYATNSFSPHVPDGFGFPYGKDILKCFRWQHKFLKLLSLKVRDHMIVRIYPGDYACGNRQREQFEQLGLNLRIDDNKLLMDSLLKSKLVVLDSIVTVFFEVIAYEIPVLVFHDESMWEFDIEFEPICEEMKKVGILHVSPESAAKFLSEKVDTLEAWWNGQDVQSLVERLKSSYVRTCDDPVKMLINQLDQIIGVEN
jgi:putative transferase (TIGR04331 family)